MQQFFSKKIFLITVIFSWWSGSLQAQTSNRLTFLGQVVIPFNHSFDDTPVGGLSGLTYDSYSGQFYAISDDRSEHAPARFYSFHIELNSQGKLDKNGIEWTSMHILQRRDNRPYTKGAIDPEGIALGSDNFIYVSSEGVPRKNIAPFINAYSKDGTFARAFTIPKAYWRTHAKSGHKWGIRTNLGFEGLTVSPDATTLYGAIENALWQDGPAADSVHGSPARIIMYDLPSGNIVHEYQYDVAPIHVTSTKHGSFAVNGLSDLLALDNDGGLLTLERNFVLGQGNRICLYAVSTQNATDIKGVESLKQYNQAIRPVSKRLIADLSELNINIDNFEGLVLGPKFADGSSLLLMVSDNNFSPLQQTIFTAFKLDKKK